ncbi:hypothetical protein [Thermococcus sp. MAR1]|uniref:hypothetical protein n=1 Tax=Thermococcus sp. MAR1 TaxID=1638263 RepID=UPI00143AA1C5|nr:hypothetical protein [Thermococcus sp. MAR1]NJE11416.1 hypothetical protein [Thermococcus sp. MAR1]
MGWGVLSIASVIFLLVWGMVGAPWFVVRLLAGRVYLGLWPGRKCLLKIFALSLIPVFCFFLLRGGILLIGWPLIFVGIIPLLDYLFVLPYDRDDAWEKNRALNFALATGFIAAVIFIVIYLEFSCLFTFCGA